MINFGLVGEWKVLPPPGLTQAGTFHRFQERTVQKLSQSAARVSQDVFSRLQRAVASTYREGEGTLYNSLQYNVKSTRDGVSVEFMAGGRHLVYLTALAGEPFASPGHFIPNGGRSRFYWKNPLYGLSPGIYTFPNRKSAPAFWRPRQGRGDVIADVMGAGAQQFVQTMIKEHETALIEFVQNDLAPVTRSPRVNVAAGSGIAPQ